MDEPCLYKLTPLIVAAGTEIAKILLANSADINSNVECCGLTALYIAAVTENRSMVKMLLECGADKNIEASGESLIDLVKSMRSRGLLHLSEYEASENMGNVKRIIEEESRTKI
ncbi:hypothetical protein Trydic_g272 [Trypoxylus dichotomus]